MLDFMLYRKKSPLEDYLKSAFNTGYANAASSLRKLTKDKVYFNNFHFGFYRLDSSYLAEDGLFSRNGANLVLTTEVFGDLVGKSYLLISDREFEVLTQEIPESTNPDINFKEEFAKELDNILSASVITALSNELKLKIYGDIPVLVGKMSCNVEDLIYDDFSGQAGEVYVTAIYFSFENQPSLNPFFIWVVNSKTLDILQEKSINLS